jgi:uncharacterized phage-like protein YoqJ
MKAYYYTAQVSPVIDEFNSPFEYFKAFNKKQINKYLTDNQREAVIIYDPQETPVHGIYYKDVTEIHYNK